MQRSLQINLLNQPAASGCFVSFSVAELSPVTLYWGVTMLVANVVIFTMGSQTSRFLFVFVVVNVFVTVIVFWLVWSHLLITLTLIICLKGHKSLKVFSILYLSLSFGWSYHVFSLIRPNVSKVASLLDCSKSERPRASKLAENGNIIMFAAVLGQLKINRITL